MGMKAEIKSGLSDALFSKTQQQVLGLIFGNPDRSYYINEIVRFAGVGSGTVQRELERLFRVGLLTVARVGNQKHYQANREAPIFQELRGIVLKTFGVADTLRQALELLSDRIQVAFIYGSVASRTDSASSDIDVMIVSNALGYAEVITALGEAETRLGRRISPTLYSSAELSRKLADNNGFLQRVVQQDKIFLIGSADDLP